MTCCLTCYQKKILNFQTWGLFLILVVFSFFFPLLHYVVLFIALQLSSLLCYLWCAIFGRVWYLLGLQQLFLIALVFRFCRWCLVPTNELRLFSVFVGLSPLPFSWSACFKDPLLFSKSMIHLCHLPSMLNCTSCCHVVWSMNICLKTTWICFFFQEFFCNENLEFWSSMDGAILPLNFYCKNVQLYLKKGFVSRKKNLLTNELQHLRVFTTLVLNTILLHPLYIGRRGEKPFLEL